MLFKLAIFPTERSGSTQLDLGAIIICKVQLFSLLIKALKILESTPLNPSGLVHSYCATKKKNRL